MTSEEGENEDGKWITVTGRGKTKKLLKPKLKPKLQNAFAILSQPDNPTRYNHEQYTTANGQRQYHYHAL